MNNPINLKKRKIWSGIFGSFDEIVAEDDVYNSNRWLETSLMRANAIINGDGSFTHSAQTSQDYSLDIAVLAALESKDYIKVLDFGGGYGKAAFEILSKFNQQDKKIHFYILENLTQIEFYKKHIVYPDAVNFVSDISQLKYEVPDLDIVHFGSVLQYFDDYVGTLTEIITQIAPRFIVFSDLMAGEIPTYVTVQNYYGLEIPFRFFNFSELNSFICKMGYRLCTKEFLKHDATGEYFPQEGFSEHYQITASLNCIYRQC